MSGEAQKLVVSMRMDGLGARLAAMMNGLYIAEKFGLPYRFSWPPMNVDGSLHGLAPAEELFAPEFLAAHHTPHLVAREFVEVGGEELTSARVSSALAEPAKRGFNIRTCHDAITLDGAIASPAEQLRLWQSIKLSSRMQAALDAGRAAAPAGAVAIHLRRGDTVYGEVRRKLHNDRFTPLGWVKAIIAKQMAEERPVVLFSDDPRLVDLLYERYGALTAARLGGDGMASGTARALFDIGLMSGCAKVVGAYSIYSRMATILAQTNAIAPRDLLGGEDLAALVLGDLERNRADYTALDRAKELQFVANELSEDVEERLRLLAEAFRLDPENPTHAHQRAALLASLGRDDEADAVLRETIERGFVDVDGVVANLAPRLSELAIIGAEFERGAAAGRHPYLAAIHAHRLMLDKREDEALEFAGRAHRLAPDSAALVSFYAARLMRANRHGEAREKLAAVLSSGRDGLLLRRQLSEAMLALHDADGALEQARAAHDLAPDDIAARIELAALLMQRDAVGEAVELAAAADPLGSVDARLLMAYARIMKRAGRLPQARAAAERAVGLQPGNRGYRGWLRQLAAPPPRARKLPLTPQQRIRRKLRKIIGRVGGIIIPKR